MYRRRPFDCRQFFYARYIDWAFTTPLMLIDLLGFSGATADTRFFLLGVDFLMIIAGLIGSFVEGDEKYAFFGFGMLMFAPIIYYLLVDLKAKQLHCSTCTLQSALNACLQLIIIAWVEHVNNNCTSKNQHAYGKGFKASRLLLGCFKAAKNCPEAASRLLQGCWDLP